MPELPEVETVCRQLEPVLLSRSLKRFDCFDPKLSLPGLTKTSPRVVRAVWRSGKQIVIELCAQSRTKGDSVQRVQQCKFFVIHLRMTGRLLWKPHDGQARSKVHHVHPVTEPPVRALFEFEHGVLLFADTRRFGTIQIFQDPADFQPLGCDPIRDSLSEREFLERYVKPTHQPLKLFLMRQDRLVGIGNIYASEILFDAKLSPFRVTSTLDLKESSSLLRSTRKILTRAIDAAGTTFSDYRDSDGSEGNFQNFLKVYEREGLPCRRCRSSRIQRIVQAQRSTYYCPRCQSR